MVLTASLIFKMNSTPRLCELITKYEEARSFTALCQSLEMQKNDPKNGQTRYLHPFPKKITEKSSRTTEP